MPSSRSSSSIGLPGTYGSSFCTQGFTRQAHRPPPSPRASRARGNEPSTRNEFATRPRASRTASRTRGSLWWPSRSRKNTYSHGAPFSGPRLDAGEVHAVPRERLEQAVQRARLRLAHGVREHGEVVARGRRRGAAEHEEARGVVAAVLDRARHAGEAALLREERVHDRRRARPPAPPAPRPRPCSTSRAARPRRGCGPASRGTAPAPADGTRRGARPRGARSARSAGTRCAASARRASGTSHSSSASSACVTTPSLVFSIGSSAWSAWPRSTAPITSPSVATGTSSTCGAEGLARGDVGRSAGRARGTRRAGAPRASASRR